MATKGCFLGHPLPLTQLTCVFPSTHSLLCSSNQPFSCLACHSHRPPRLAQPLHLISTAKPVTTQPASLVCCQVRAFRVLELISCWSDFVTLQPATDHRTQSGLRVFSGKTSCLLGSILITTAFPVVSSDHPWL